MATIAQLGIVYDANTRGLTAGLRDAKRQSQTATQAISRHVRTMSMRFRSLTGSVFSFRTAIGVLAGGAGIGLLVKNQLAAIDTTAKFSRMIGETSQQVTSLQHAASITAGVTEKEFNMAFQRMVRRLGEAANGSGEAKGAIEELGLEAKALVALGPAEAFRRISDAIQSIEDPAHRVRIAFKLFDSEGAKLVNTLNVGSREIAILQAQAIGLGIAFNDIDAAKVEAANDAITEMKGAFGGMARIVTVELADPIQAVTDSITEAMTSSTDFQDSIRGMTRSAIASFAEIVRAAGTLLSFVEQRPAMAQFGLIGFLLFGKKGALIGTAIGALFEGVRRELARLGITTDDNTAKLINLEDQLGGVNKMLSMTPAERVKAAWGGVVQTTEELVAKQQELQRQIEATREQMQAPEIKAFEETWSRTAENINSASRGMFALADALERGIQDTAVAKVTPTPILDMEENPRILANAEEHVFIEEQDKAHMERRKEIFAMGQSALFSSISGFLGDIESAEKSSGAKRVGIMSNAFGQLFSRGAQHNKKLFEMNKVAGIANAIVSTYQGAAKALEWGFPLGPIFAAAILAAGFAQVSAIRGQQFQGGGAAPSVGSAATPSVTPIAEQSSVTAEPEQDLNITFVGRSFSDDQMRDEIIPSLIEAFKDGTGRGRLRVNFA